MSLVLVDTSSWIHFLRPDGEPRARARVEECLNAGTARWCVQVRLELWNGASGEQEKKALRALERVIPELRIDAEVWTLALDLARRCRAAGVTVPASDLLIAACARHHAARIEHSDSDFEAIGRALGSGRRS